MRRALAIAVVVLPLLGQLFAVEKPYQQATITDVQQKVNTRVLYYIVNTPITKDEPYFEVSVQLKDMLYVGRYTPRHADDTLPDEWQSGFVVEARIQGRHLFLKRPSGTEIQFVIVKQTIVKPGQTSPEPPSARK